MEKNDNKINKDTFPYNLKNSSSNEYPDDTKLNHMGVTDEVLFGFTMPENKKEFLRANPTS